VNTAHTRVVQANRRHGQHSGPVASYGARRVHRDDFQAELHRAATDPVWRQPGRRHGPTPLGPDTPKANKLTDRDGNPRIVPLSADQRVARYFGTIGTRRPARPRDDAEVERYAPGPTYTWGEDARRHAALLGLTMRQRRRMVHKANRTSADNLKGA